MVPLQDIDGHLAQLNVDHVDLAGGASVGAGGADAAPQFSGHILGLLVDVIQVEFNLLLGLLQQIPSVQVAGCDLVQPGQQQGILGNPLNRDLMDKRKLS